jgi:TolB-like protein/Flp pilus assembly protein TadD
MARQSRNLYEFGPFRLNPVERLLLCEGRPVNITPKAFEILLLLVQGSGRLIEKSEFMTAAWADSFVEESNLTVCISMLRRILGKEDPEHKYIQTVAKRGYRLLGDVREIVEPARILSLAVLPFRCLAADPTYSYLNVGLSDAIITRLARSGQLVVRPTTAMLRYEDKFGDPLTIGREQKVDAILAGHIEILSGRVRVTVQLVRVEDGSLLWASSYDKSLQEIFALEDEVAEGVAQSMMAIHPSEGAQPRLAPRNTENSKAYRLYLEGRYFWNKRTREGLRRSIECFQQAATEDSQYALVFAGLADSYVLLASHGVEPALQALPVARAAALKALELDDSLAEAHTSLGMVYFYYEWDFQKAEHEFQRAISLNPNYIVARMWYASNLAALGRIGKALLQVRHAEELDPLSLGVHIKAGRLYYWNREYDRAVESHRKVLSLNPQYARARTRLGMTYAAKQEFGEAIGEFKEAQQLCGPDPYLDGLLGYAEARSGNHATAGKILHKLVQRSRKQYVPAFSIALIYIGLGEASCALEWLEKAYDERSSDMVFAKVEPLLDPVRADPQFAGLLRRMGLL